MLALSLHRTAHVAVQLLDLGQRPVVPGDPVGRGEELLPDLSSKLSFKTSWSPTRS